MNQLFRPKFFTILKEGYSKKQFIADLMAGAVVGIVALPLAIAFAVASGVSPEKGLVTAVIAGFLISLLGGSRVQIGGPTGAFIVIVYGIVEKYGVNGLIISTIMAGIILVIFGLLRLGTLLKFFPRPLIVGFTSGIAVVIFSTQIKDALGMDIAKVPSAFVAKWICYAENLSTTNLWSLGITLLTILIVVLATKKKTKVPGSFFAIILITAAVQMLHLPVTTIETFFGNISGNIQFIVPQIKLNELSGYLQPALTIALLGGIESLLSAVVADGMISGNHRSNTELIAQGIANIVTPFFGGIPATGAIARTATNVKNGGRTPMAGIVHAITLLLIMLFFGQWAKLIPMSVLAGILIVVSYNMSEWRSFKSVLRGSFFDITILISTFLLTVFVDLTVAIEIGVVLSALLFMKRMSDIQPLKEQIDSDLIEDYSQLPKDIGIYEISGPLFFASAKEYCEVMKETGINKKVLIIRMRHVPFMDATGTQNLKETVRILKSSDIKIILSGVNGTVKGCLDKGSISHMIGEENICPSFENALKRAEMIVKI
jgi:SulP family sulfate permease